MAFVIFCIVSITLLLRVETAASSTELARLRTRENARLALMMAIGQLQRYAGPDLRATARREITGSPNPFWTGVWDTTHPSAGPHWLISWQDQSQPAPTRTMQLVGSGSAGSDTSQYVSVPIIEVPRGDSGVSDAIAWWIGDEGVKASVGEIPLHLRARTNFIEDNSLSALNTQLATSFGLEEIFKDYDRFDSDDATMLDRVTLLGQLPLLADFSDPEQQDLAGESTFHALTPRSLGVLASVVPGTKGGFMQDLSLFPRLIGPEFEAILTRAETRAKEKASLTDPVQALREFTPLRGVSDLGPLVDGQLASPITPILSNFMMAFTIRSAAPIASHPDFYLRMRFFCEFWNPYTSGLMMQNAAGEDLDLELEITGLPSVVVEKTTGGGGSSPPINIQDLLKDPANPDGAVVIRLHYDQSESWLPGQSKNWTGVDATTATGSSPYDSILTDGKTWYDSDNSLGGSTGIDTGVPRLTGNIRHVSTGTDRLTIRVYRTNDAGSDRSLLSELDGIQYEPVSTRPAGYSSTHSGATFGYHFILRGPHQSDNDPEYYRGLWLHDHDPRNPKPSFNPDWQLDNDPTGSTGSAYIPVKDGISPLPLPVPAEINETDNTINTVVFRRIWDRSRGAAGAGNEFSKLWQDAPLFELPRERLLSLASLQHLYFHNERPFKVGNSWGADGTTNTLAWFDRYYFSGLSRSDTPENYDNARGLPNPALVPFRLSHPQTDLAEWQASASDDAQHSTELASKALVRNRFNLNSTSVAAWKAALGGLRIHDWAYLDYPEDSSDLSTLTTAQDSRTRMFARFSQSLSETYDAPPTPEFEESEPVAPSAYYRRGARYFDADEIEALASEIVRRLKLRGEPFYSMEAFLSPETTGGSSLLEQAIATVFAPEGRQKWDQTWETQGVRGGPSAIIEIDHFSPGFLTQADVMTAIGPMLAPRSDTFKIRARAESYSPQGQTIGSATLEATIQRLPEALDPTAPINQPTERKLQLISIRWLSDDEI